MGTRTKQHGTPNENKKNKAQSNTAASFEPVLAAGRCSCPAPVQWVLVAKSRKTHVK
jgi:hypothetical protein